MLSSSFVAYFLLLSAWSSLGLDRTDRLLINSDPQALQVQINNLIQKLGKTNQEVSYLKSQLSSQHHQISSCAGSTFTVWGKQSCPKVNGTELVYNGFTSGSQYNEKGNGVNTLCLPHDPENLLTSISVSTGNDYAHLYGAEYQFNIGRIQIDDNVPCAVCQTKRASSTIMIPGKRSCPIHWQKQYTGILTANWYDYQESEYLCIDEDPDYVEGSRRNENGRLFYPVKTVCGSLPCPPYENGNLLTCVVCSK
ncbi:short-chain collagen C4-like [Crassostrea angulata]|uniref:short-chain collagen C4-like n=1 Tax=Magallana angulata TaxID=2784310 RepID=UPI0022B15617|nr:short-chain collagen C4-like [Crassostrea angulata]